MWLSHAKAAMQLNDTRRAEVSLKKAIALAPESSEAHLLMGYMRLRQNDLASALPSFKKAAALDPANPEPLFHLATIAVGANRVPEAVGLLEKYLAMTGQSPANVETAKALLGALKKK
jgi:Tfp pilus assembly protein PilF